MNKIFAIALFLLTFVDAKAMVSDSLTIKVDSTRIEARQFPKNLSDKYNGSDFQYDTSIEGEAQNFITRAIYWFFRKIGELFGVDVDPGTLKVLELIIYVVLIVFGIYLVTKLLMGKGSGGMFGKKDTSLSSFNIREEAIEAIDFDQLIAQAMVQKDYRLVVRYQFLKVLQELSNASLISWHFEKTNSDYYHEIENPALKEDVRKVSYLYDHVWYGAFDLDEAHYNSAQHRFDEIKQHLKNAR